MGALAALAAAVAFVPAVTLPSADAAAPLTSLNCQGKIAKPTGGLWKCTLSDDFDTWDSTKWTALTTAATAYNINHECYLDDPANNRVEDGKLLLTVREVPPFTCHSARGDYVTTHSAGMASTYGKFSQAYGRFEIRAKFPAARVAGLQSALWLWPDNPVKYGPFPNTGEIDIAEFYTKYPDHIIPVIHYNHGGKDPNFTSYSCGVPDPENFHIYLAEWFAHRIVIKIDGHTCVDDAWMPVGLPKPAPFDQPFFINLTQGLGVLSNSPDARTPYPATTEIDYVRVWE